MNKINTVVIPIAGFGSRMFPTTIAVNKAMLPIVNKPVIQYIIEECVDAGINHVVIIMSESQKSVCEYFGLENKKAIEKFAYNQDIVNLIELVNKVKIDYVIQKEQKGLGHAIYLSKEYVKDEYFGVILGDNPIRQVDGLSYGIGDLYDEFKKEKGYYIGVTEVDKSETHKYGIVESDKYDGKSFKLIGMEEKPINNPKSNYAALGRYILKNNVYDYIECIKPGVGGEIQITDALRLAIKKDVTFAIKLNGVIHDTGNKIGFVKANIDYATHLKLI